MRESQCKWTVILSGALLCKSHTINSLQSLKSDCWLTSSSAHHQDEVK